MNETRMLSWEHLAWNQSISLPSDSCRYLFIFRISSSFASLRKTDIEIKNILKRFSLNKKRDYLSRPSSSLCSWSRHQSNIDFLIFSCTNRKKSENDFLEHWQRPITWVVNRKYILRQNVMENVTMVLEIWSL